MAQTTDAKSFVNSKIEIAPETAGVAGTYVDYSGSGNAIEMSGGDRMSSEAYTSDGDTPIVSEGKREPLEITVKGLYTEVAAELTEFLRAKYEANERIYLRWSPTQADVSGDFIYTTTRAVIINPVYPSGDASSADLIPVEVTLRCAEVVKSEVA